MLKRACALLTAMVMMLSLSMTVSAKNYEDTWYYSTKYLDAFNYVSDNGYMIGTTETTFVPDGWMTRAMLVTILYSMAGKPECTNAIPFPDVKEDDWFYNPVRWAYAEGMTAGNGRGEFSPHSPILKQDAILILYKYAIYSEMEVRGDYGSGLLAEFLDAENISDYAVAAVKWAVEKDIFPAKSDTLLQPKSQLDRASMALLLAEYGENVEHIVYGRDDYSFNNSTAYFTEDYYYLADEHYQMFADNLDKMFVSHEWISDIFLESIMEKRTQEWTGSCYGMAITTILDKLGKIDFNGSFDSAAPTMHDVTIEKGGLVESAINYYYLTQFVPFPGEIPTPKKISDTAVLGELVEIAQQEKGLKMFCYTMSNGAGHTVVAYDIDEIEADVYRMQAYDNRDSRAALSMSNGPIDITIDIGNNSCTVHALSGDETVESVCLITDFTHFDLMDINAEESIRPPYGATDSKSGLEIFVVELSGDFLITNTEGKELICIDSELSGDMKVISHNVIYNGPDMPAQMVICVEVSDGYCYEALTEGMSTDLSLCNELGYAAIAGTNIKTVQIDSENRMEPAGTDMDYAITYRESEAEE